MLAPTHAISRGAAHTCATNPTREAVRDGGEPLIVHITGPCSPAATKGWRSGCYFGSP